MGFFVRYFFGSMEGGGAGGGTRAKRECYIKAGKEKRGVWKGV